MRRLFIFSGFIFVSTIFSLIAQAAVPSAMQDWHVSPIIPSSNDLKPYCAMANQFDNGFIVTHSRNNLGLGSMALDFPDAAFEKGRDYKITLAVDNLSRDYAGIATKETLLIIKTGRDETLFNNISSGAPMTVILDKNTKYTLSGNIKAFFEFEHCLQGLEMSSSLKSNNQAIINQTTETETKKTHRAEQGRKVLKKEPMIPLSKPISPAQISLEKTSRRHTIGRDKSNLLFDNIENQKITIPSKISNNNIAAIPNATEKNTESIHHPPRTISKPIPKSVEPVVAEKFERFRKDFLPRASFQKNIFPLEAILTAANIIHSPVVLEDSLNNIMRWDTHNGDVAGIVVETPWENETSLLDVLMDNVDLIEQTCEGQFESQIGIPENFGDQMIANVETKCTSENKSITAAHTYQGIDNKIKVWTHSGASEKHAAIIQNRDRIANILQQHAKANAVK